MQNKTAHSKVGKLYEEKAAEFLIKNGCDILERNYRCKFGEIDLIIKDGNTLAFVEVKYKANASAGSAEEAVTITKMHKICRTADYYRFQNKIPENLFMRFDVIAINDRELKWYQNAFDYQ